MKRHFRRRLLEERERLHREARRHDSLGRLPLRESTGELSAYDNHPADMGSETFERSKDLARRRDLQRALADIDLALQRLEEGIYGYCQRCGRPIPRQRLEVLPATPYCGECARQLEAGGIAGASGRPVEEELLSPPFARTWRDASDEIDFDGEDAWQAVARYGTSDTPQDVGADVPYPHVYESPGDDLGLVEHTDRLVDTRFQSAEDVALAQEAVREARRDGGGVPPEPSPARRQPPDPSSPGDPATGG